MEQLEAVANDVLMIRDFALWEYQAMVPLMKALGYPSSETELRERMERIVANPAFKTIVAEWRGQIVGFIGLCKSYGYERNGISVRIMALVVDEQFRNKGIGTRLLRAGEAWARNDQAICVVLNSNMQRIEAHRFYEKEGYQIKGYGFFKEL